MTSIELEEAVRHFGGALRNGASGSIERIARPHEAGLGHLAVLFDARYVDDAVEASRRGATILVSDDLAMRSDVATLRSWAHPHATWVMAELLDRVPHELPPPVIHPTAHIDPSARVLPGVRIGARVVVGPMAVVGAPGFGWATSPTGALRAIPQRGGVLVEDDVHVGAGCTIASGTLGPTVLRKGVKLDAQVHVAHNCEIGEGTLVAAQSGFAGSVVIGRGVLVGGQVGIADHVRVGDGAKIAAKSGVIGDVPAGVTVAGYPAVERARWLRGWASLYRGLREERRDVENAPRVS